MNLLTRLYPGDVLTLLALSILVQIAIISLLAVIASRTFASRNAALRHCILLSALLWIGVSPIAAWRISLGGWFRIDITPRTPEAMELAGASQVPSGAVTAVGSPVFHKNQPANARSSFASIVPIPKNAAHRVDAIPDLVSAASAVWLLGLIFQLFRLVYALRGVATIRRKSLAAPHSVETTLIEICQSLSISKTPAALVSDSVHGPVSVGCLHPAIILPAGLLKDLAPARLREIFIHEAVHASRHDYAVGIFQRLIAALLWFHPMVHLLNRELSRAREEVCDNAVLRAGRATDYARTLLELGQRMGAQTTFGLVPGLFSRSWRLEQRVAGILHQRRVIM